MHLNFFNEIDLEYLLDLPEVIDAKEKLQKNCTVDFTIPVNDALREYFNNEGLSSIPMRWVKGDTKIHIDKSSVDFEDVFLVYLTDSQGSFVLDDTNYPIIKNTAFTFGKNNYHGTTGTGIEPRLILGPMSEHGISTGIPPTIIELTLNITDFTVPIVLPLVGSGPLVVSTDWGDGNIDSLLTHTYLTNGVYNIIVSPVSGTYDSFGSSSFAGAQFMTSIDSWGNDFTSLNFACHGAVNLTSVPSYLPASCTQVGNMFRGAISFNQDISTWDVSNLTNISYLFFEASVFNQDISPWIVGNVTNMDSVFFGASSFNQPIGIWDTSGVIFMNNMFEDAIAFNQPIGAWNTGNVTNMIGMFNNATAFNQDISAWNVSNVTNMDSMFRDTSSFDQPIGTWNTGSVIFMNNMFLGATTFNQPIGLWNVGNVTNMINMFAAATSFNQDIGLWNVGNVTNMIGMFFGATAFNQDIGAWNTGNVTNMASMFTGATAFNQDISAWDVSKVEQMGSMFENATVFNQDLGAWDIRVVQNMSNMLDNTSLTITNYDAILNGWANIADTSGVKIGVILGAGGLYYDTIGEVGRNILIDASYNWVILGDAFSGPPICYNKGTKILVVEDGQELYKSIELLQPGDLVKTYLHGDLPIEFINSKRVINNPNVWSESMYRLPSTDPEHDDLVVTGGHGILKPVLTRQEISADKRWFIRNQRYSKIDNMYLQRAAFCKEFIQLTDKQEYTYYHLSLKSNDENRRYGIWANGILSESTFKSDMLKIFKV